MADGPFASAGLSQFGGDKSYSSGNANSALGSFLAAYLANKTGLIDYSDPTQRESVNKNGVLGHLLDKAMDKAVPPNLLGKNSAFEGIPAGNNPVPESSFTGTPAPNAPTSGSKGMDLQLSSAPIAAPPINSSPINDNLGVPPLPALPPLSAKSPSSGNAGMDQQLSSSPYLKPSDYHDFDTDIGKYASMMGMGDIGSLASFLI
jgi:hypothetical protein